MNTPFTVECEDCSAGRDVNDAKCVVCGGTGVHAPRVDCRCEHCSDAWFIVSGDDTVLQTATDEFSACAHAGRLSMLHPDQTVMVLDKCFRNQPFLFVGTDGGVETRELRNVRGH